MISRNDPSHRSLVRRVDLFERINRFEAWFDRRHWTVQIVCCLTLGTLIALVLMAAILITGELI